MEWVKISLTAADFKKLNAAEKKITKIQLLKRIQCIKLKHEGWKHKQLAVFFSVTIETISAWLKAYNQGSIDTLLKWNKQGRKSVMTVAEQEILKQRNAKQPFNTAKEAKEFIEQEFGYKWHLHWVQKLLKKNFDFRTNK